MNQHRSLVLLAALICLDAYVWFALWGGLPVNSPEIYFLDVGQGDATLIRLPHGINILTDAGPDSKVMSSLAKIRPRVRRIDLAVISHPQLDHFNGFRYILDKYPVGAVILNGRNDPGVHEWDKLIRKINGNKIPVIVLGRGDLINIGESNIRMLGPTPEFRESGELNDTALVEYMSTSQWSALLTGDIGFAQEKYLIQDVKELDILKVGHHGSKFSTGADFLSALRPSIAAIGVGRDNHYGHPASGTMERLEAAGVKVFRTDIHGSIRVRSKKGGLQVISVKNR